jgi:hypothetical protein
VSKVNAVPKVRAPKVHVVRYPQLRDMAELFHSRHNPGMLVPVPIELILEVKLEFNLAPLKGLLAATGQYGFLTCEERTITVDAELYQRRDPEFRLTLAHEFAHFVLHWEVLDKKKLELQAPLDFDTWKRRYLDFPEEVHLLMERQAETLANLLVVPTAPLRTRFNEVMTRYDGKVNQPGELPEAQKAFISKRLGGMFNVPERVIRTRIEKDGLWDW